MVARSAAWLLALLAFGAASLSPVSACEFCGNQACCAFSDAAPLPPDVAAFRVQGGRWPHFVRGQPLTLTYSYHNMFDGGLQMPSGESLPDDYIRAAIEEALGLWASVVPVHFVEVPDQGGPVATSNYPDGQYGQIRFAHRYINGPDIPGQSPRAKAIAYYPASGNNIAGDVFFDNGDPWQPIGTISEPDILGAAVHEIGHTLGLGHTTVEGANMYWTFLRTSGLGTGYLHEDDIAGIQTIYGAGVGSVTPLAVPEPATLALAAVGLFALFVVGRRK